MKNIIKSICFLVVFALLFLNVMQIFSNPWDYGEETYKIFYNLPKDSVDVVLIGPSGIKYSYLAPVAYETSGISSYPLANSGAPFSSTKHVIIEAEKTQNPKVYVIDLRKVCDESESPILIHGVADSFKWSKNRFDAVTTMLKKFEGEKINKLEYYFPFSQNHQRWNELSKYDFAINENLIMGCILQDNADEIPALSQDERQVSEQPFGEYPLQVLNDFLDFCDTLDAQVLFVQTPHADAEKLGKFRYAENIIAARGYEVLDANLHLTEMNYDFKHDNIDPKHSSVHGAVKYTTWLSEKLKLKYNLPSHKNDEKYKFWGSEYDRFLKLRFKNTNSLYNYANIINEEGYTYYAYLKNDDNLSLKQDLSKITYQTEFDEFYYANAVGNQGLNIIVVDNQTNEILDSVCFDVFIDIAYATHKQ